MHASVRQEESKVDVHKANPVVTVGKMTSLSCVVLSFNSERCISQCLQKLSESINELEIDFEIWVVDNGSTDRSVEIIERHQSDEDRIHLIRLTANLGTTVPRNLALRKCSGDMILVLDSDAYVNADGLQCLIDDLRNNPDAGIVAPKLVFADGRAQMSTDKFPTVTRKLHRLIMLRSIEQAFDYQEARSVDYAISAAWLMNRDLLHSVGMLDERIFYAPEDADYCLRTWESGYHVRFQPSATFVHDAQEKSRTWLPNNFTFLHLKGLAYFFLKHRYFFSAERLRQRLRTRNFED